MTTVDALIREFGSPVQALLHLRDDELEQLDDAVLNGLFDAAGYGHLLLPVEEDAPVRKTRSANGARPKKKTPGRTV